MRFMRSYGKRTREDVNHEYLRRTRINTSKFLQTKSLLSRTENQQERESKLSQESGSFGILQQSLFIKDSIQDNHTNGRIINIRIRHSKGYAKNQTQTRQSFNNIRENETKTKVDISSKLFLFVSTILSIPLRLSSISLFIPSTKTEQKSNCEKNRFSSFNDLQKFKKSSKIKKYFLAEKQTSQSVIKVLNLLVNFIYFTILKPLLFGYKNIQFLDSCFIDNTKIKTTTTHQITCNKTEINQSDFHSINKFNKFQSRNGIRSGIVEHNSILKTKLKIFNNNLITNIKFKTILNSFMCSLENFPLSFNKFLLNFCDKLNKINFLRKILYDTCKKFLNTWISYVICKKCMELINGIEELYITNNTNTYSYDTILKLNNFRNCNNYNNYNYSIDNYEYKQKFFIKQIINKIEIFLHKLLAQLKLKLLSYYNNDNKNKNNNNNNIINESLYKSIIKKIHRICLMLKTKSLCEKLRTKCNLSVIDERKFSVKNYINSDCELNENHIKHYNNNNNSDLIKCLNYVKYLWKTKLIHEHFNNNIAIYHNPKRRTSVRSIKSVFVILLLTCVPNISESFHHNIKYSTNIVKTKYGPLRGIIVRTNPTVEAFLGVPYASPPVGSLRFMPPVTPSTWRNARLSDRFSAVCPQAAPVAPTGPEALLEVPRGRLAQLRRLLPLLANQSEDCLYLNLYVPRATYPTPPSAAGYAGDPSIPNSSTSTGTDTNSGPSNSGDPTASTTDKPVPAIVYIHGESYEWNSGNPYDGSVMAAHGNVIVVTINFRLGILGFLKTGGKGSAQGNFGLMDLVAALHWLRENLPAFGGDPNKVTVMGHGTGAALANVLVVSPVASDLVHRAILLSGSALSPWAIQKEPLFVKRRVAEQTGCHGDMIEDDLAPCLRTKSISELLAVKIDSPRFLPGFAPFVDGTVIVHPPGSSKGSLTLPVGSAVASTTGIELADFPNRELLFGLTTIESYLELSAQDLEFGFNETRRDRILRTYVRNVYHYHLNEIYSALKNEYTDWERPVRNPMGSRDAALELLSDGHTAAPLVKLGYLHSLRGGRSYFLHFKHQSSERDFPQRGGSVRGEDVPFCLGLPISPLFPHNYTKQDIKISRILLRYISNFAQTGNPNETPQASVDISHVDYSKSGLVSSSLTLSSPSSPSLMATVPESEVAVKRQSEGLTSSVASLPSLLSSPFTLVKHSNDQYSPQLRSSGLQTSGTSPAFNSPSIASSSTAFTLSTATVYTGSGSGTPLLTSASSSRESTDFLADPNLSRTGIKPKVKRNAVIVKRRRSKTVKRNLRQRSNLNGNKKFLRKKYPGDPSGGYVMADQGVTSIGSRKRPRAHYDNELSDDEEEEEEDDEGVEDEDEEEDEGNIEEDDFDAGEDDEDDEEEIEENSGRIRGHHMDEEDVEKFDRFDDTSTLKLPFWDNYDAVNQLYLELGNRIEIRNHYRGHKLSMWLSLIPQLHSPGDLSELPMRHHHFLEDSAQFYDGIIRPQITSRPNFPKVNIPIGPPILHSATTTAPKVDVKTMNIGIPATTTECPPNTTIVPTIAATRPQNHQRNGTNAAGVISANEPGIGGSTAKQDNNNLLRRLANSQYQSYTTALTVTIAVGCFLLLLNVLIFAGIYYQREKRANDAKKKEELREAETRCSSSPNLEKLVSAGGGGCGGTSGLVGSGKGSRKSSLQSLTGFNSSGSFGEYSCYDEKMQCKEKHALADICSVELPLKEFKCSSMSSPSHSHTGSLRRISNTQNSSSFVMYPPSYHHPPPKIIHHFEEQPDFSNNGVVTYQQFHKQQHQQTLNEPELLTIPISCSSTVGTSTEPCNQSTQSELSSLQNIGTSVDDKAVGCTESNIDSPNLNGGDDDNMISPGIPNPPPPPKSTAPYQGGILRQPGPPTTPGSSKKRVQIQEISV